MTASRFESFHWSRTAGNRLIFCGWGPNRRPPRCAATVTHVLNPDAGAAVADAFGLPTGSGRAAPAGSGRARGAGPGLAAGDRWCGVRRQGPVRGRRGRRGDGRRGLPGRRPRERRPMPGVVRTPRRRRSRRGRRSTGARLRLGRRARQGPPARPGRGRSARRADPRGRRRHRRADGPVVRRPRRRRPLARAGRAAAPGRRPVRRRPGASRARAGGGRGAAGAGARHPVVPPRPVGRQHPPRAGRRPRGPGLGEQRARRPGQELGLLLFDIGLGEPDRMAALYRRTSTPADPAGSDAVRPHRRGRPAGPHRRDRLSPLAGVDHDEERRHNERWVREFLDEPLTLREVEQILAALSSPRPT